MAVWKLLVPFAFFLLAAPVARAQPVTLINVFEVPQEAIAETIRFWEASRDFLARQPGYVSTRLHQAIMPDSRFQLINVAVWESAQAFAQATQKLREEQPATPPAGLRFFPGLFRVIRE